MLWLLFEKRQKGSVRGLTFFIKSIVFQASREGASFHSIVSVVKEAKLMEREEFGDPKRARTLGQFHGASSGGRGLHKGSGFFQHRGPFRASMPTSKGGHILRGSSGGSHQRPIRRENYSGFLGSAP